MNVIPQVARNAHAAYLGVDASLGFLVAILARCLGMATVEQEACRRVIEIPGFPRPGCMASLAFLAVSALVLVVLLVTTVTT